MKRHSTSESPQPTRPASSFFALRQRRGAPFFQLKLQVGQSGDRFEQEADRVAHQISQEGQAPPVQLKCAQCAAEEEAEVRRQPSGGAADGVEMADNQLEQRLGAARQGGQPLPGAVEQSMSSAFGQDFSGVRVHTGGPAVQLSQDLRAEAFTHGRDIYFNQGNFAPDSPRGKKLLAHELTHVVQQGFAGNAIQREEKKEEAKKDPLAEGLKITAEKALEIPKVKEGLEGLWNGLPKDTRLGLATYGGLHLGFLYLSLALSPKAREAFSDVDLAKPLTLIPYVPLSSFKYKLPDDTRKTTEFSAELDFEDYFDLLKKALPGSPFSNLTLGVDTSLQPGGGLSLTGGKFGLDLLGGGIKLQGNTFDRLSPYPLQLPGRPGEPPSTLVQSVPGLPDIPTGPGFQGMINFDLLKLFPGLRGAF